MKLSTVFQHRMLWKGSNLDSFTEIYLSDAVKWN